ncbi:lipid-A-disaccharide synthase N-terminal domain-containing protein [Candidatus Riflebacteria bacterium]
MDYWLIIGLIGQLFFSLRFIVQWLASEKKKESIIPLSFWFFSIGGSIFLLAYSIYRRDPVFILGQSCGLFIYFRNLYFIFKKAKFEKGMGISELIEVKESELIKLKEEIEDLKMRLGNNLEVHAC